MLRAVVFDVGETLVDESRQWALEARRAGVPPFTMMAVVGALIERGGDHRQVWDLLGLPTPTDPVPFEVADLYPDAVAALAEVADAGMLVGVAGNQPEACESLLASLRVPLALVASSARWGVAKPSGAFFDRMCRELGVAPSGIAYVGDRPDNDVVPAHAAGMVTVLVRRGPWGHLHARLPDVDVADLVVDDLGGLVAALGRLR